MSMDMFAFQYEDFAILYRNFVIQNNKVTEIYATYLEIFKNAKRYRFQILSTSVMLISNQLTVAVLHPQMFHDLSQYTLCVVDNDATTMYKNYRLGTKYMYTFK